MLLNLSEMCRILGFGYHPTYQRVFRMVSIDVFISIYTMEIRKDGCEQIIKLVFKPEATRKTCSSSKSCRRLTKEILLI